MNPLILPAMGLIILWLFFEKDGFGMEYPAKVETKLNLCFTINTFMQSPSKSSYTKIPHALRRALYLKHHKKMNTTNDIYD